MSSSYSRDPNDLLLHPSKNELFAPPMNYLDAKNSGVQPVIYRNAILKQPLADFETGLLAISMSTDATPHPTFHQEQNCPSFRSIGGKGKSIFSEMMRTC